VVRAFRRFASLISYFVRAVKRCFREQQLGCGCIAGTTKLVIASGAKQSSAQCKPPLDCFVARLLAMTRSTRHSLPLFEIVNRKDACAQQRDVSKATISMRYAGAAAQD
jgi:hypothetical protein